MRRLVSRLFVIGPSPCSAGLRHLLVPTCFRQAAARSGGQGWPKAIAERLGLDGREPAPERATTQSRQRLVREDLYGDNDEAKENSARTRRNDRSTNAPVKRLFTRRVFTINSILLRARVSNNVRCRRVGSLPPAVAAGGAGADVVRFCWVQHRHVDAFLAKLLLKQSIRLRPGGYRLGTIPAGGAPRVAAIFAAAIALSGTVTFR